MTTTLSPENRAGVRVLAELFAGAPLEQVGFRFWDGTPWPDGKPRRATIVLQHRGALRAMFSSASEKGLAEAYLADDFDIVGDVEAAFELTDFLGRRGASRGLAALVQYYHLRRLPAGPARPRSNRAFSATGGHRHSLERDRRAVTYHYDVSNDFFRLWLDHEMVYSCAYFARADDDLDTAQAAKLDLLCRKLRLRPGQRLLDIGCGWGGLALHAARRYGVTVTGVTLSRPQVELATARAAEAGLDHMVTFAARDYRELPETDSYDAIVSVGMSEHVGAEQLAGYFETAGRRLKPGGVFLNHAISEGARPRRRLGASFADAYVFPDGDIPPVPVVLRAAEAAGLEVRDVENLREHYALTLRHWVRRLEAGHEAARAYVDEAIYRVWRLYMAGSAYGFAHGHLAVYQVLLSKSEQGGVAGLPLTRRDWYA
ncbi:MAG TPA: cyclopropane-fatty-acyl-phospholipid synthase family protein [Opitutaceae bacterium]|nr:cyclopropane-fatty-acyl-phospholipid synthase family protein [Opitutaceae bacterium]